VKTVVDSALSASCALNEVNEVWVSLSTELKRFRAIKPSVVERLCRLGRIPSARVGRQRFVRAGTIERFLNNQTSGSQ
jgi:hypothetical protein